MAPLPLILLLAATPVVGPREVPCPVAGAVEQEGALRSLLALPGGPADIWVKGRLTGDFAIGRSLRLHGCEGATLVGSGTGTVLQIQADDVSLEDLRITKSGNRPVPEDAAIKATGHRISIAHVTADDTLYGIQLQKCLHCKLEWTHVRGRPITENLRGDAVKIWESHDSEARHLLVEDSRDVVVWYSRRVVLEDNTIRRGRYGTHFMYAHDSVVRRSDLRNNTVGIFVMYSNRVTAEDNVLAGAKGAAGMGIGFKESDDITLRRNLLVANTTGVYLDHTPFSTTGTVAFEDNGFHLNQVAMHFHSSEKGVRFVRNDFSSNDALAEVDSGGDATQVAYDGNYWSEYAGYDLNHDGVGDVAFILKQSSSELWASHPGLRYFQGTASLTLYDAIVEAIPFMGKKPVLADLHPAMLPHREISR
jgi:nitrous oxidase accessory protein